MEAIAKLKGGALARLAGQLCDSPTFQSWLGVQKAEAAAMRVRTLCQIESRAQLDHDAAAAKRFHDLVRRPFLAAQLGQRASAFEEN